MNKRDEQWAEHLLSRVNATTGPHPEDAARNLAGIEARLGLATGGSSNEAPDGSDAERSRAAARTAAPSASAPGRPRSLPEPSAPSGAALSSGTAWKLLGTPTKAGLVLSFGLLTGVIGYFIGRSDAEQHRAPIVADSPSVALARVTPGPSGALTPSDAPPVAASEEAAAPIPTEIQEQSARALGSRAIDTTRPAPNGVRAAARVERRGKRSAPPDTAVPSAAPARSPSARPHPSSGSDPDDRAFDLRDALELLRRAEGALRQSDGLEARTWLTELDRRAPPQLLREERLVTLTLAECLLGNAREAQQALHELELANAESMYRARLEGSCVSARVRGR